MRPGPWALLREAEQAPRRPWHSVTIPSPFGTLRGCERPSKVTMFFSRLLVEERGIGEAGRREMEIE